MTQEIRLRKIAKLAGRETIFDAEESMVARITTQTIEVTFESLLVVGADCANAYGSAVVQSRTRRIIRYIVDCPHASSSPPGNAAA